MYDPRWLEGIINRAGKVFYTMETPHPPKPGIKLLQHRLPTSIQNMAERAILMSSCVPVSELDDQDEH